MSGLEVEALSQGQMEHADNLSIWTGIDPGLGTNIRPDPPVCRIFLALSPVRKYSYYSEFPPVLPEIDHSVC